MDIVLIVLGIICLIIGLIGCIVPMIPGPPVSYVGILLIHITDRVQFTPLELLIWLAVVIVVQVLDYVIPAMGSRYFGGSKWGAVGCIIGTIIGLFFMPIGIIAGPFLGAFLGELIGGSKARQALKSGLGSLIGFLLTTVAKCIVCGYMLWQGIVSVF